MTRYPLAPLATAAGIPPHTLGTHDRGLDHPIGTALLAQRLHLTVRTIRRYNTHGLTALQADRAAITIGTHPALIWPDWWPTHDGATTDPHWYRDDPPLDTLTTTALAC